MEITTVYSKALDSEIEIESNLLKPVIRSGQIGNYWADPTALVLFPYSFVNGKKAELISEREMKRQFPKAWEYLSKNKKLLSEREHGKFRESGWYQLYPKNLDLWEQNKIMVPYMVTRLSAYHDVNANYFVNVTTGGFGIVQSKDIGSMLYVTGLLNSKLLDWFLKSVSTTFHGGYFAANKQYLAQLPIHPFNLSDPTEAKQHQLVVTLVDYILFLKADTSENESRDPLMVSYFEQIIDALVYELYLPDEIHAAGKEFFAPLVIERLPVLDEIKGDKLTALRQIFERLFHKDHVIRQNIFFLDTIESVRIIEGKA